MHFFKYLLPVATIFLTAVTGAPIDHDTAVDAFPGDDRPSAAAMTSSVTPDVSSSGIALNILTAGNETFSAATKCETSWGSPVRQHVLQALAKINTKAWYKPETS
ncbi:hypothetical protein BZA05DRAFT_416271 [Tricharina praecox]|uniref:uncharacterized protein n=1 Tax=Tricharina praecox TaxID=43433 RepID=UPI00221FFA0B|nr:uncharacterized protein BZA05DRAFT_416271 [Tricharina praecox]KAI5856618.1 hypothetical protein BZA05DRAFT_416271 [Tricharina praecox]